MWGLEGYSTVTVVILDSDFSTMMAGYLKQRLIEHRFPEAKGLAFDSARGWVVVQEREYSIKLVYRLSLSSNSSTRLLLSPLPLAWP